MGKLVYQPEIISEKELDDLLRKLKERTLKVDHFIARSLINDINGELNNEIDNIESGARAESEIISFSKSQNTKRKA